MLKRVLLCLFAIVLAARDARAQAGMLTGTVVDAKAIIEAAGEA